MTHQLLAACPLHVCVRGWVGTSCVPRGKVEVGVGRRGASSGCAWWGCQPFRSCLGGKLGWGVEGRRGAGSVCVWCLLFVCRVPTGACRVPRCLCLVPCLECLVPCLVCLVPCLVCFEPCLVCLVPPGVGPLPFKCLVPSCHLNASCPRATCVPRAPTCHLCVSCPPGAKVEEGVRGRGAGEARSAGSVMGVGGDVGRGKRDRGGGVIGVRGRVGGTR